MARGRFAGSAPARSRSASPITSADVWPLGPKIEAWPKPRSFSPRQTAALGSTSPLATPPRTVPFGAETCLSFKTFLQRPSGETSIEPGLRPSGPGVLRPGGALDPNAPASWDPLAPLPPVPPTPPLLSSPASSSSLGVAQRSRISRGVVPSPSSPLNESCGAFNSNTDIDSPGTSCQRPGRSGHIDGPEDSAMSSGQSEQRRQTAGGSLATGGLATASSRGLAMAVSNLAAEIRQANVTSREQAYLQAVVDAREAEEQKRPAQELELKERHEAAREQRLRREAEWKAAREEVATLQSEEKAARQQRDRALAMRALAARRRQEIQELSQSLAYDEKELLMQEAKTKSEAKRRESGAQEALAKAKEEAAVAQKNLRQKWNNIQEIATSAPINGSSSGNIRRLLEQEARARAVAEAADKVPIPATLSGSLGEAVTRWPWMVAEALRATSDALAGSCGSDLKHLPPTLWSGANGGPSALETAAIAMAERLLELQRFSVTTGEVRPGPSSMPGSPTRRRLEELRSVLSTERSRESQLEEELQRVRTAERKLALQLTDARRRRQEAEDEQADFVPFAAQELEDAMERVVSATRAPHNVRRLAAEANQRLRAQRRSLSDRRLRRGKPLAPQQHKGHGHSK